MRRGFPAALIVLLAGHGLALAQHAPSICNCDPVSHELHVDVDAQAKTCGLWGSGEYLLWWFKDGRVPPLATAGGDGVLGSPGTRVLLDDLDFADDVRHGGRFELGYQFAPNPCLGIEASYFFITERLDEASFSPGFSPVLGRPFFNITSGAEDAFLVSSPGEAVGSIIVESRTSLWGAEANLTSNLIESDWLHLLALGGFRFLRLEDHLTISDPFLTFGNTVGLVDDFRTVNRFYGGQVGLEAGVRRGTLTLDVQGKIAVGRMHQEVDINGVLHRLAPDGSTTTFLGGLYALRSNIGRHQRDELAFVPELNLNLGWQLTPRMRAYAGYSFLWISTVARAGEQIDPVVNTTQFPIRSGNGALVGPARPAFNFVSSDFWAQGLNFGLELRY